MIDSLEVTRRGAVRRAKLYYLRGLRGRAARIKEKQLPRRPRGEAASQLETDWVLPAAVFIFGHDRNRPLHLWQIVWVGIRWTNQRASVEIVIPSKA